jgi:trigger factor
MQSQVHEIDPVTVELEVEVPWDRVHKGLNAGYGKLQKSAKVRGFRRGKVPRNVLQQLYGRQVDNEVVTSLIEEGILAAVQTHDLAVVASPEVDSLPAISKGQPLSFRPKLETVVTDAIALERPATAVSDAEVDAEIDRLRERHAEIVTPEEVRPSKNGDLLTVDYTVEIDGEENAEMAATGRSIELGGGRLLPEFEEGLVGKKVGDDVEIRVAYGEDTQNPDLKNKRVLFRVKINELREKVLPALDDELAKDLGEHETLAELREKTREELETTAKSRAESALREQAVEQLVEKNPIPVPPSLVHQQLEQMKRELAFFMRMAGGQGFDLGSDEEMAARAEKKVRAAILMGELARQQELTVTPEEVDAKLQEIAEQSGKHIAKVRVEYAGERREGLESKILEDKLLDYLMSKATVTDAPPVSPATDAPKGA